ncbi:MAG: ABC transporter ATP-binding protein [Vicinamibacterales bacterium]
MSTALRLDRIVAGYDHGRVLTGLTLTVPDGSLTALVGPSGCGKTTALRVTAGLMTPASGDVWLGTRCLTTTPAEQRGLAMVFQRPLLFPHMSVADNVGFGLEMRGVPPAARRVPVAEALALVHLDGFGSRRPHELSGGQEQRVALARALVTEPSLLLLDEPLSALDAALRGGMRDLVRRLQRRLGITTVFVTHDQHEAMDVADRIAVLLDGTLAQEGPPRDFLTAPSTAAIARFFGWVVLPDGTAFHPTAARVHSQVPAHGADRHWSGLVERVADLGPQVRVSLRLERGEAVDVLQAAQAHSGGHLIEGAVAHLIVPDRSIRRFAR